MEHTDINISRLLSLFVTHSEDGYAIFDREDRFIFVNATFARWGFEQEPDNLISRQFTDCVLQAYQQQVGVRIETDDIQQWLQKARSKRWSQPFRAFEVDLRDGRWMLVSEQVIGEHFLFLHATDVTRTKNLEFELRQAREELHTQAHHDELTGVPNRRAFIQHLKHEIDRREREKSPLTLAIFDLDHFKRINDQYGHPVGDQVLMAVTQRVGEEIRKTDLLARIGGEEFGIILNGLDNDACHMVLERIRHRLCDKPIMVDDVHVDCTISIGATCFREPDKLESLFNRADENLYLAKHRGRNCLVLDAA
jgi:diguanylate cyclase (GGDEF)-like protein